MPPFGEGAGSPSNTTRSPGLKPTSMSGIILIHPAVWPQLTWAENLRGRGSAPYFREGQRGPHLTQSRPGPRPTSIPSGILTYAAIWPQRIWAENWAAVPLWGRGARSPSNRMPLQLRHISVPSGILIHQAVWQQQIWAKNRGPLLGEGSWVPIQHNGQGRGLPPCQFRLDPSNRLATIYQRHRRGQTDKGLIA